MGAVLAAGLQGQRIDCGVLRLSRRREKNIPNPETKPPGDGITHQIRDN
jgi:hypothetical protein